MKDNATLRVVLKFQEKLTKVVCRSHKRSSWIKRIYVEGSKLGEKNGIFLLDTKLKKSTWKVDVCHSVYRQPFYAYSLVPNKWEGLNKCEGWKIMQNKLSWGAIFLSILIEIV